jgi:hypothetical protein
MLTALPTTTLERCGRIWTTRRSGSRSKDESGRPWTLSILLRIRPLGVRIHPVVQDRDPGHSGDDLGLCLSVRCRCPAVSGCHRLSAAGCAEYVPESLRQALDVILRGNQRHRHHLPLVPRRDWPQLVVADRVVLAPYGPRARSRDAAAGHQVQLAEPKAATTELFGCGAAGAGWAGARP